jgi:hypothetical protein
LASQAGFLGIRRRYTLVVFLKTRDKNFDHRLFIVNDEDPTVGFFEKLIL